MITKLIDIKKYQKRWRTALNIKEKIDECNDYITQALKYENKEALSFWCATRANWGLVLNDMKKLRQGDDNNG